MVECRDLVAEFLGHIDDLRHLVGAVAVVLHEDLAVQHVGHGVHRKVALGEFPLGAFLAVFGGLDPGLPIDREVAHARGGHLVARAVDALGVLAASHLHAVRRAGELHRLHGAGINVLEHDRTPANEIGRAWQDLQRRDPAIGQRAREAGILRPDAVFGPDLRRGRCSRLVAIRMGLHGRAGIDTEVAVDVDHPGRHELARTIDALVAGGHRQLRIAHGHDPAALQQHGAVRDFAAGPVEHRRADDRGRLTRIGLVGRRVGAFLPDRGGGRGLRLCKPRARGCEEREACQEMRGRAADGPDCAHCGHFTPCISRLSGTESASRIRPITAETSPIVWNTPT